MTGPLRVAVAEGSGAGFANAQAAVWASLPLSLSPDPDDPQLLAVDGRSTDWPAAVRRAVDSAVLGVVVVRPGAGIASSEMRVLAFPRLGSYRQPTARLPPGMASGNRVEHEYPPQRELAHGKSGGRSWRSSSTAARPTS